MKGVIVAAGYGTRFLPVTKTIPKEMLPLVTRPSIEFIVEEFLASGIDEILFITSRRKKALEDYFDREVELESAFRAAGDLKKLAAIAPAKASFFFVRQPEMRGTGHALLLARPFTGGEPFVVAYPDDLHFGEKPLSLQLIETWKKTGCTVLATLHDPPDINRYGVISIAADGFHVTDIVEKPPGGPSRAAKPPSGAFSTPRISWNNLVRNGKATVKGSSSIRRRSAPSPGETAWCSHACRVRGWTRGSRAATWRPSSATLTVSRS